MNDLRQAQRAARFQQVIAAAARALPVGTRYYYTSTRDYRTRQSQKAKMVYYVHIYDAQANELVDVTFLLRYLLSKGAQGEHYQPSMAYCYGFTQHCYGELYDLVSKVLHPGTPVNHVDDFSFRDLTNLDWRGQDQLAPLLVGGAVVTARNGRLLTTPTTYARQLTLADIMATA